MMKNIPVQFEIQTNITIDFKLYQTADQLIHDAINMTI